MIGVYAIGEAAIAELVTAGGSANYTISAVAGAYTYTGQAATITKTRIVTAVNGSYTITGQAAVLLKSKLVTAAQGSYTYTGQAATLLRSKLITAANGTYAISGQAATITYTSVGHYTLTAATGAYTYTGQAATVLRSKLVTAAQGSYAYTGQAATLLKSRLVSAANGAYSITGQSATIDIFGGTPVADPFAKWTPFKLACRYSVLQRGSLNIGNTRQNVANLLALARAEADAPSNPPWARWRTAVNSPRIPSNLMINVPRVPGFIPHGGYFGRMWDWIVKYLKGVA